MASNIWNNPGEIANNNIDDDGNGYIDDVRGWDFIENDNDPIESYQFSDFSNPVIRYAADNGADVIIHPALTPAQVEEIIVQTANPHGIVA